MREKKNKEDTKDEQNDFHETLLSVRRHHGAN
jgi:hypothetical protein